jgi:hypothetical protein
MAWAAVYQVEICFVQLTRGLGFVQNLKPFRHLPEPIKRPA